MDIMELEGYGSNKYFYENFDKMKHFGQSRPSLGMAVLQDIDKLRWGLRFLAFHFHSTSAKHCQLQNVCSLSE